MKQVLGQEGHRDREETGSWYENDRRVPRVWIDDTTFYNWKAKYCSLEVYEARRLKALEDENSYLKRPPAEFPRST